jgi:hypothetical protein
MDGCRRDLGKFRMECMRCKKVMCAGCVIVYRPRADDSLIVCCNTCATIGLARAFGRCD